MAAFALIIMGGGLVVPALAQTVTIASEGGWFSSVDWVGGAKTVVYFLLTLCGLAALGFAAWVGIQYVSDTFQKAASHIRQQNEGGRIKAIQDGVVHDNQDLDGLTERAQTSIDDAEILAEQRFQMFLTSTHSAVNQMKTELEQMKYRPGILPKFNGSEIWFWSVIFVLIGEFVIECAVNVVLLGKSVSFLDAGAMAVFFAMLNILGAFLAGRVIKWMWQKKNHAAAFSAGTAMVGLGIYIAAIFGKFRDIYTYGHKNTNTPAGDVDAATEILADEDIPAGDFDAATGILVDEVFPPSLSAFDYSNITSYQPFIVAVIFFVLAMIGAWKIYDPYSEMRQAERRLRKIYPVQEKALQELVKRFKADLRKWPDDIATRIQQQGRKIASGQGELGKFDPRGPNVKAAQVAGNLLSNATKHLDELRARAETLVPKMESAVRTVDAHGKKTLAELVKIHKDIADFTTPRQGAGRGNTPNNDNERREPTL